MTERYTLHQNGNNYRVIDEKENVPMIMIEFKENEFPVYACFHRIIDRLNDQDERLKELQQTIDTIAKDYEYSHGMDIRNAEWFTAW